MAQFNPAPICFTCFLALLLSFSLIACDSDVTSEPEGVVLDGTWIRSESTNNPNDGMRVEMAEGQGILTFVPETASSNWQVGQVLWQNVVSETENSYSIEARGSDGNYYDAVLTLITNDRLEINIANSGAGSEQTWERG